ncbi:MAG TPA: sugar-binding domain-containing protein [Bacillota bacterium]|nr:sugar-binding domain-containing protein [Bacillota bacterium]
MQKLINLQEKMVPELIGVLERRYNILRSIYFSQPIGRRVLAARIGLGERLTRSDTDFLRDQKLITTDPAGMWVTPEGEQIIRELEAFIHMVRGLNVLEQQLAEKLNISRVLIVPGDSTTDETVKQKLGQAAADYLRRNLSEGAVVAVTGGSTLLELAEAMPAGGSFESVLVVPTRGGLGEQVELQANIIAARLASRLGGSYRLLHVPDNLSGEVLEVLSQDPGVKEVLEDIARTDIVVHGIGTAVGMAIRRGLSQEETTRLLAKGAVSEAMGSYFDTAGREVDQVGSLGLTYHNLQQVSQVIAVAGGSAKAEAIRSVVSNRPRQVLVTDEGAARLL